MGPTAEIVPVERPAQFDQALAIRMLVFVDEQGVERALELDGCDDHAHHLLALLAGEPVGTLRVRLLEDGRIAKIERVAVLDRARGSWIGLALLQAALDLAETYAADEARLHAQTHATRFYQKLGFAVFGPEFDQDGLPHVAMWRPLRMESRCSS